MSDDLLSDDELLTAAVRAVLPRLGELVPVDHDRVAAELRGLLDGSAGQGGDGANRGRGVAEELRRVLDARPAVARWIADWIEANWQRDTGPEYGVRYRRRGTVPHDLPPLGDRADRYDSFLTPAARPTLATLYYCSLHPALPSVPRRGLKSAVPRCSAPQCGRPLVRDDR
ncbi:hypothetical protein ACIQU5_23445 [Streptomyces sp. NPDC090306]|uniref:hypothetical protein n=1 Tax=Streptomyces sp. NPDC090306 TaxID=3365961 RepID=UPI00381FBE2C